MKPPTPAVMPKRRTHLAGKRLTEHARQRIAEMGVSMDLVELTISEPQNIYDQTEDYEGRLCYQRGNIGVVVAPDDAIVTVLWRSRKVWQRRLKYGHTR